MSKELKILINNEEVVCDKQISIKEEMLSTSSTILKNCYPKSWENDKDYTSKFYFPKDYSKCKIFNETYYPEKPGLIVSGSNLSIDYDNTLNYDINELKGNTEQQGSPTPSSPQHINNVTGLQTIEVVGKNLFDRTKITENTSIRNDNGATYSNNDSFSTNYINVNNQTKLAVSGMSNSTGYLWGAFYNKDKSYVSGFTNNNNNHIVNIPNNAYYIRLGINNSDLNTLMINYGDELLTYEEYKGQKYEINLGKNLFDVIFQQGGLDLGGNGGEQPNTIRLRTGYISVLPNTTYTISNNNTNLTQCGIGLYKSDNSYDSSHKINSGGWNDFPKTFTTESDTKYIRISFRKENETITPSEDYQIQLEKGSQATSYSEYFTPIELNHIPNTDYQDRIYKQNNKWYIEKKIGKVVLDGDVNKLSGYSNHSGTTYVTANYNNSNIKRMPENAVSNVSDKLKGTTASKTWNGTVLNSVSEPSNGNYLQVCLPYSVASDLATLNTWLTNNNITIYYILNEPEITEITNTDLINQLDSIKLLNGTNNINVISSNLSGILNIHYNYKEAYTVEDLIFCGCVKNTGNISLNPREPHYVDLQILDFKTLLSEGETLNYVIANKTISEAISQVINSISDYGFVLGDINLSNSDEIIGAYSTLNKTAYDVFQYFADITQSKWTTRMIDEDTIAIDFYDPLLMEKATTIENTKTYAENNKIIDISFNYSTNDYRNKQIITSDEVFANITQTETILADGYAKNFNCQNKIGIITEIKTNGVTSSFITKNEQELGLSADYIYTPGKETLESSNVLSSGTIISITYYPIVKGREIVLNTVESSRISNQINRKGTISRYENRNDTTSSQELIKIGQSYIKYKGKAEITLKIVSENDILNVGQIVNYEAPLEELAVDYMVKSKTIDMYLNANKIFYTYELSSNFNSENAINYFDNQRAKNQGNIGEGETITRNIDIENTVLIKFYDTDIQEVEVGNYTSLDFSLDGVII